MFDPLGVFSPVSVSIKKLFQELCMSKQDWDEPLSNQHNVRWEKWVAELDKAREIVINRCVYDHLAEDVQECYLQGFGNASTRPIAQLCI